MIERKSSGKFAPGTSGNPTGRPRTETATIRKQLADKAEAVVNTVIQAALTGDLQACKLVLDRVAPPLKSQAAPIELVLPANATLASMAEHWIRAVSEGSLPSDIGAQMVGAIGQLARVIQVDELQDRLDALERVLKLEKTLEDLEKKEKKNGY